MEVDELLDAIKGADQIVAALAAEIEKKLLMQHKIPIYNRILPLRETWTINIGIVYRTTRKSATL